MDTDTICVWLSKRHSFGPPYLLQSVLQHFSTLWALQCAHMIGWLRGHRVMPPCFSQARFVLQLMREKFPSAHIAMFFTKVGSNQLQPEDSGQGRGPPLPSQWFSSSSHSPLLHMYGKFS